jgi:uncharacterized hydrophobic protein (TIGR00271 family)
MIHLRILVPKDLAKRVLDLLCAAPAVSSVVHIPDGAKKPRGDVILCDVAREDASVILSALKELDVHHRGSIAVETVDSAISDVAIEAEKAASGLPSDAVVWEEVEQQTSENTELSIGFLLFMVLAMQIGAVGILTDQPILIVGAMVVGPEFGPLAGLSVALVGRRRDFARRSLTALGVGFAAGIVLAWVGTLLYKATGVAPDDFSSASHDLTGFISNPDFFSFTVAFAAGIVGMLSLTNAKSGALIGVLISVTTIPAASNIGVAAAYGDWEDAFGAAGQLAINLATIVLAGVLTLYIQRRSFVARRRRHLREER